MNLEVHVRRKTRDLVCNAAEDALRTPEVVRLDRAEVWTFRVDPADAAKVRQALADSTLVANPNVHRWTFADAPAASPAPPPEEGLTRVRVRVRDRVDARGASVLRAMRDRRGVASLDEVRHAILWTVDIAAPRAVAEDLARRLTGLSGRGAGLLANPHAQDVEVEVEGP